MTCYTRMLNIAANTALKRHALQNDHNGKQKLFCLIFKKSKYYVLRDWDK